MQKCNTNNLKEQDVYTFWYKKNNIAILHILTV